MAGMVPEISFLYIIKLARIQDINTVNPNTRERGWTVSSVYTGRMCEISHGEVAGSRVLAVRVSVQLYRYNFVSLYRCLQLRIGRISIAEMIMLGPLSHH